MQNQNTTKHNLIVFYDGDCVFCSRSIQFIIRYNSKKNINFSALQSEFSQQILKQHSIETIHLNTLYFIENNKIYARSTAILKIATQLSFPLSLLRLLLVIPVTWRDKIYNFIASKRHQLFKNKSCWIPDSETIIRFIK